MDQTSQSKAVTMVPKEFAPLFQSNKCVGLKSLYQQQLVEANVRFSDFINQSHV